MSSVADPESGARHGDAEAGGAPAEEAAPSRTAVATGGRILLVFATRHGSTREVAEALAEELRAAGRDVNMVPAGGAPGPSAYDGVIIGGPMIFGWHKDTMRYVKKHRRDLMDKPTALFITAASLTDVDGDEVQGVPVFKDPWLAKAPRDPARLGRKERYARPSHYLGDVLKEAAPFKPRTVAFFGGSLDLTTMNILEKIFVLLVIGATPGDARNWKVIREWGAELNTILSE